jgi:general secretion pathway protein I
MSSGQRGFTLIEVLVAVLVFGLIATAASEVGSNYIGTYERIRDKTLASWIAENRIAELRLAEKVPGVSENTDDLEYANREWRVNTVVSATQDPRIRRADVVVLQLVNNDERRILELSGFIGDY